ncbi:MAG: GNAT family N-acetyltransferase [Solirubrobacterales bacterium]|nr:GNAT family N-acetyltransferase [Solirubrobacterales bacterium]
MREQLPSASRPTALRLRALSTRDLGFSVRLHGRALPTGLFPRLGTAFLRAYHQSFAASPHGVAVVVERDGVPIGFLLGATRNREHLRWTLRRRGLLLAPLGALGLLRRPVLASSFIRVRLGRYVRGVVKLTRPPSSNRSAGGRSLPVSLDVAGLAHIAIDPEARGHGAGGMLVTAFVEAVRDAGVGSAHLVTQSGGDGAGVFYERLGWRYVRGRVGLDGDAVSEYQLDLDRPTGGG